MKIYPAQHEIIEGERVDFQDIPLSYIDTQDVTRSITINSYLQVDKTENAEPFEEFDHDTCLFDENHELIAAPVLIESSETGGYYYKPLGSRSFLPKKFQVKALIKKNMSFKNDRNYNLRLSCYTENERLAESLISILGSAPDRGECPRNIWVNDKNNTPESLENTALLDNDFLIVEDSEEGTLEYYSTELSEDSTLKDALSANVNLWLNIVPEDDALIESGNIYLLKEPVLYNKDTYTLAYSYAFDLERVKTYFPEDEYIYHELFVEEIPVIVLEKENQGFIIISATNFFIEEETPDPIVSNKDLFYEIIMFVFFSSYYTSPGYNMWITNNPIDRIACRKERYNLTHRQVTLESLLNNKNFRIESDEYSLIEIKTDDEDVAYQEADKDGYLSFTKTGGIEDPIKEEGQTSIFSIYNGIERVIYYREDKVKKIETPLSIEVSERQDKIIITISPFKSTINKINLQQQKQLEIQNPEGYYYLVRKSISDLEIISYNNFAGGTVLGTIYVQTLRSIKSHDLRVKGGGLLKSEPSDYNLFDIGHILGRPYRAGASFIVRLPASLKPHQEIIEKELDKYKMAGDYFVLLFE